MVMTNKELRKLLSEAKYIDQSHVRYDEVRWLVESITLNVLDADTTKWSTKEFKNDKELYDWLKQKKIKTSGGSKLRGKFKDDFEGNFVFINPDDESDIESWESKRLASSQLRKAISG